MTDVLMSIKPVYAARIFGFTKGYEYRRVCPKLERDDIVVVYESAPTMRVVGQFPVVEVLRGSPSGLWRRTCGLAGIDDTAYMNYFGCAEVAYAIRIGVPVRYPQPIDPRALNPSWRPPQSYTYTIPDLGDLWGSSGAVRS